jgi:hypothetical protein
MPSSPARTGAQVLADPVVPPLEPAGFDGPPTATPPVERAAEPAPGLADQIGSTRESLKRLVGAHVELGKAELADIADAVKQAAAFAGVAIAAAIFAGLLIGVGVPLWLGEWIFGSIGWGILLGILLLAAVGLAAVALALGPTVDAGIRRSFVVGAVIGIVVGVIFGLDVTNRAWSVLADNVAATLAPDSRPLIVAVVALGVIGAIAGLVVGLASGMGAGSIGTLVVGAVLGIALGALTAAAPGRRVGAAIGVAAGLIAWSALMGQALVSGGFDTDKLKDRFWPSRTIDVTKETIEWARERMPLKRPS